MTTISTEEVITYAVDSTIRHPDCPEKESILREIMDDLPRREGLSRQQCRLLCDRVRAALDELLTRKAETISH